jgi:hypothetical protein
MPGPGPDLDQDFDDQDRAEVLDETNLEDDVGEFRTFEEIPDVYDVTSRVGDRDDESAVALDADEFDEQTYDQDELEDDDEGLEFLSADETDLADEQQAFDEDAIDDDDTIEGLDEVGDADTVTGGEDDFTNFQSKGVNDEDLERMGYNRDKP